MIKILYGLQANIISVFFYNYRKTSEWIKRFLLKTHVNLKIYTFSVCLPVILNIVMSHYEPPARTPTPAKIPE